MSKKADKRAALKAEKAAKQATRTVKQLAQTPAPAREVKENPEIVIAAEKVVSEPPKLTPAQTTMSWTCKLRDQDESSWSWGRCRKCVDADWENTVRPFLVDYQNKKWGTIDSERTGPSHRRRTKHIYYTFDQVQDEIYDRLVEMEIDDMAPNLFRFRLSGKKRVFGYRIEETFHFIWYDPEHNFYKGNDE